MKKNKEQKKLRKRTREKEENVHDEMHGVVMEEEEEGRSANEKEAVLVDT